MKKILFLVLSILLTANLCADFFSDANKAYENRDYKKSSALMQKACENGHMRACWNLGLFYSNGRGVNHDKQKALSLYKTACDGGNAQGCTSYEIFKDIYTK